LRVALDTNRYVDFARGDDSIVELLENAEEIHVPLPTNDVWIAALVLQHGLVLCARDSHFDQLPQIPRT
jgi:predicted nucleic acid-binding protein